MCKKTQFKYCPSTIDKCMRHIVDFINNYTDYKTLACCCGHGKYPSSIIVKRGSYIEEIFSEIMMVDKKKFYKKDKQGYYFIPEVIEEKK